MQGGRWRRGRRKGGDGRSRGVPRGVRACLPRSRNNGSITTPSPPDSITSSPLETHPLSLFLPPRALFLRPAVSLARSPPPFSRRLALPPRRSFGSSDGAPSPVPSLPSPIPATPSFLYTTSFAVVGEGETPAFAVGEAVLFFPLIKADRCGSGCRDDGTRGRRGEREKVVCREGETRGARRQRDDGLRWLEEGGGEPGTA